MDRWPWRMSAGFLRSSPATVMPLRPCCSPCRTPWRCCWRSGRRRLRGAGAALPARLVPVLQPDRPDDGHPGAGRVRPSGGVSLSYQELPDAVARMCEVDLPVEPTEAWPDFRGLAAELRAGGLGRGRKRVDAAP